MYGAETQAGRGTEMEHLNAPKGARGARCFTKRRMNSLRARSIFERSYLVHCRGEDYQ